MNGIKLIALAAALVVLPAAGRAQQPDSLKPDTVRAKVDTVRADTGKKESTPEKVGRQTGKSLDKAAKTTERNAKVLGKRTADNTREGAKDAATDIKKAASKAGKATKTNAKHLKAKIKKATSDSATHDRP